MKPPVGGMSHKELHGSGSALTTGGPGDRAHSMHSPAPTPNTDLMGYERGNPDDEKALHRSERSIRSGGSFVDMQSGGAEHAGEISAAGQVAGMEYAHSSINEGDKGYMPAVANAVHSGEQTASSNFANLDATNAAATDRLAKENQEREAGSNMANPARR